MTQDAKASVALSSVNTSDFFGTAPYAPFPAPEVSASQLRLGLISSGFSLASLEAGIAEITDTEQREATRVKWEYSTQYHRDSPIIRQIGDILGLSDVALDALWTKALSM